MRTTLDLDDDLMKKARVVAAETGRTLTAVVEDALRQSLTPVASRPGKRKRIRLEVYGSGGAAPGIDLDSNASIQAFLDEGLPIEKLR